MRVIWPVGLLALLFLFGPLRPASGHDGHTHAQPQDEQKTEVATPEMMPLLAGYCTLIVLSSVLGGMLPKWMRLTHVRMQTLMSGVGGLMLGIAIFHLMPHSIELTGSPERAAVWLAAGLLGMFFLIRAFHFHHHGAVEESACEHEHDHDSDHEENQPLGHQHSHSHGPHAHGGHSHRFSWLGVAFGLSLHTLIDGLALGASVQAEAFHGEGFASLFGLGTFLAIVLHKPLDAVSISVLMESGGWSAKARNIVNIGFALMCPLGALMFLAGIKQLGADQNFIVGCALAFSAGVFLCISLGDLLPELELHSHHRVRLSVALLLGVALAWGIEQTHSHDHNDSSPTDHSDHGHRH
ncbi:ZIP family metal transporter [Thalassoroseus pseudoceratinae]|uniref:ZIP family metal transporter n=1 Tax=Thalassoroseus pseudoceratinae TaxID=2713176 RepID=UPI001420EA4A|nr:ZIP family metal transporter [Thalassoroseus pseudoceratinae]